MYAFDDASRCVNARAARHEYVSPAVATPKGVEWDTTAAGGEGPYYRCTSSRLFSRYVVGWQMARASGEGAAPHRGVLRAAAGGARSAHSARGRGSLMIAKSTRSSTSTSASHRATADRTSRTTTRTPRRASRPSSTDRRCRSALAPSSTRGLSWLRSSAGTTRRTTTPGSRCSRRPMSPCARPPSSPRGSSCSTRAPPSPRRSAPCRLLNQKSIHLLRGPFRTWETRSSRPAHEIVRPHRSAAGNFPRCVRADVREISQVRTRVSTIEELRGVVLWFDPNNEGELPPGPSSPLRNPNGPFKLIEGNHRVSAWMNRGLPEFLPVSLYIGCDQHRDVELRSWIGPVTGVQVAVAATTSLSNLPGIERGMDDVPGRVIYHDANVTTPHFVVGRDLPSRASPKPSAIQMDVDRPDPCPVVVVRNSHRT